MSEYFHVKARFLRQMDNGLVKQIKEEYLVDALSFTESEARTLEQVGEGMREVALDAISRSNIKEVVMYGDTDLWFKCRVEYSLMDEESEKEKKVTTYLLINANDSKEAYERCQEHLKEMLVPFEIPKVEKTKIIEIYDHKSNRIPAHVADKIQDLKDLGVESISLKTANGEQSVSLKEKTIDCAYTKSQQVGKYATRRSRRNGIGVLTDAQGRSVCRDVDESYSESSQELMRESLEASGEDSPMDAPLRDGFPKSPTPPDMSGNGMDSIDPTQGQAVEFEIEDDFDTEESVTQENAETSRFYPDELKTFHNHNRAPRE